MVFVTSTEAAVINCGIIPDGTFTMQQENKSLRNY